MISQQLRRAARCPACRNPLSGEAAPRCEACGISYAAGDGHLDLRPADAFAERTRYLDEDLHADRRHEHVSPPLLSAGVRNDMLRVFLKPGPGDRVIDLGCGSGRVLVWNRDSGAWQVGIDVSPFFAVEALESVDLALGDLRRLPFADGAFNKAYALDVFEHLSMDGLKAVLAEAARVLEPGGHLFVYSHVRKNSRLAIGLRTINRLARRMERLGMVDLSQERLRKSDHLNPLADLGELERTVGEAGFRIARIRYYTPLVGAFVENVLLRLAEGWMTRRRRGSRRRAPERGDAGAGASHAEALRAAREDAKRMIAASGPLHLSLKALTAVMKLDVLLFGRIPSGPFFALLERVPGDARRP